MSAIKQRGKEDGGEIHAEITWDIIVIEETGRPGRHFDAWRANANVSTDQKEIHSHGSQKSAVPEKKSANARLPLSRGMRGRRGESARPLTPVSGVAASAIRSRRNGENPIEGSRGRAGEERKFPRRGRGKSEGKGNRGASPRKKEENRKTCARRGKHEKRRLRDTETAAICAHSQEKCGKRENK